MSDMTETLAATLRKWRLRHTEGRTIFWSDQAALLSAVENVLALCDATVFSGSKDYEDGVRDTLSEVRKALTDALGGSDE